MIVNDVWALREKYEEQQKNDSANVDYGYYGEKLIDIIEDVYQFSRDQSSLVIHASYDKYHSCFSDVFGGVIEYAEFAKEFNKRK